MKTSFLSTTAAVGLAIAAFGAADAGAARTYAVDITATAKLKGSKLAVTLAGKPIGRCSGTASLLSDGAMFRSRCNGGRMVVRVRYAKGDQSRGTWRIRSATGRFAGATGSGRYRGNVSTLQFRMTGKARY